jgi:hypothetical protein
MPGQSAFIDRGPAGTRLQNWSYHAPDGGAGMLAVLNGTLDTAPSYWHT